MDGPLSVASSEANRMSRLEETVEVFLRQDAACMKCLTSPLAVLASFGYSTEPSTLFDMYAQFEWPQLGRVGGCDAEVEGCESKDTQ